MSDRMNQKRRRAYEEKEKKFMENHKRNKETKHLYAAKTDCLLVCSDSDPFFGSSSVDEYFGSHSGNGFESRGNVVCPAEKYGVCHDRDEFIEILRIFLEL